MVRIEIEDDLEIAGGDFEAFVGLALRADGACPIDGDGPRQEFLRNEDRKSLRAATIPIVDAGQDRVLVVEVVVENNDQRRIEGEILFEGARSLELHGHFGDAVGEGDVRATGFVGLGTPLVSDGFATGLKGEIASHDGGRRASGREMRGGFGGPVSTARRDIELFVADDVAVQENLELALV